MVDLRPLYYVQYLECFAAHGVLATCNFHGACVGHRPRAVSCSFYQNTLDVMLYFTV